MSPLLNKIKTFEGKKNEIIIGLKSGKEFIGEVARVADGVITIDHGNKQVRRTTIVDINDLSYVRE